MDSVIEGAESDHLVGTVIATQTGPGRPRLYDDDLETISFKLPKSRIREIDLVIKQKGESRSEFLRDAVERALTTS
ncbi:MAG: ribbon-helix-helix domain-containing protein [Coriobacteriales bacterium]|nr:ribbon-helix-helix domain-containing protein [Coriobacteriales bacterium]